MVDDTARRRFIQIAGTGTALSFAGCSGASTGGTKTTNQLQGSESGDGSNGSGERATVAAQVQPDQEVLQEKQAEIQSKVQEGELGQQEAQQKLQTAREDLIAEVAETFEGRVDETPTLSVEDSLDSFGVFLITGTPTDLINALSFEEVGGLLPEETFAQAKSQVPGGTEVTPTE